MAKKGEKYLGENNQVKSQHIVYYMWYISVSDYYGMHQVSKLKHVAHMGQWTCCEQ